MIARRTSPASVAVLLGVACLLPLSVQARDMTGKAGGGALVTADRMPYLGLRYWRTNAAFELLAGWNVRDQVVSRAEVTRGDRPIVIEDTPVQAACRLAGGSASDRTACVTTLSSSILRVALGFLYRIGDQPRASLAVGVRPWLQITTETTENETEISVKDGPEDFKTVSSSSTTQVADPTVRWGVEFPLQAEAFLSDHFSVIGTVSVSVLRGSSPEPGIDSLSRGAQSGSLLVNLGGVFSGGAGFAYYF